MIFEMSGVNSQRKENFSEIISNLRNITFELSFFKTRSEFNNIDRIRALTESLKLKLESYKNEHSTQYIYSKFLEDLFLEDANLKTLLFEFSTPQEYEARISQENIEGYIDSVRIAVNKIKSIQSTSLEENDISSFVS